MVLNEEYVEGKVTTVVQNSRWGESRVDEFPAKNQIDVGGFGTRRSQRPSRRSVATH
jgi:hypothetical protein